MFPGDTGSILLDGTDIRDIPPAQRKLGLVYQDYGLFPHMKVKENFPLRTENARIFKKEQDSRAGAYGNAVHFPTWGPVPGTLSGRREPAHSRSRALALAPQVLLLDEPFSALDPATRQSLYQELRRIHRHFGCTIIIFVTHDFLEARTLAGRAAILLDGKLQTVTDTSRLMDGHFSAEVGRFLGKKSVKSAPGRKQGKEDCPMTYMK